MRRYLFLSLLALAGCVSSSVAKLDDYVEPRPRAPKPLEARQKIAVVDFTDESQYGKGRLGTFASTELTSLLVKSGQFRLFERQQIAKVLDEQKLGGTGIVDPATAAQVGKVMGVKYVVIGAVKNFGYTQQGSEWIIYQSKNQIAESEVSVKVIDVETSEILYVGDGRGYADTGTSGTLGLGGRASFDERIAGRSLRAATPRWWTT